jgi:hypothetical protein
MLDIFRASSSEGVMVRGVELENRWRQLIARQAASGLSITAFCREEGVSLGSFFGWRKRLRNRPQPDGVDDRFIAIDLPASVADAFEVVLTSGRRVVVPGRFDPEAFAIIVRILEAPAC